MVGVVESPLYRLRGLGYRRGLLFALNYQLALSVYPFPKHKENHRPGPQDHRRPGADDVLTSPIHAAGSATTREKNV